MSKIEYIDSEGAVVETVEVADADAMMARARTRAEMLGLTARKYKEPEPELTDAEKEEKRIAELQSQLDALDDRSNTTREWREYVLGNSANFHSSAVDRIQNIEDEAKAIREQMV